NQAFDDAIACTGNWTRYGEVFRIPYRALLPERTKNLIVAGRCISADRVVHKSTKEIPPCMATGQAAGIAAALALEKGANAAGIDVAALQKRLRDQGAILT
ncbi:MAG TPA: FAD-dependent oxidoreductase, partial [Candidatus Cybelea sp.]|nr:FAD-dependent oxidoreductase [Candidatus Cybelea sp.]